MKLYTKKGDKGTSSTLSTNSIPKNSPVFCSIGAVDEANAWTGLLAIHVHEPLLRKIQNNLFTIGSILAGKPPYKLQISDAEIQDLEQRIDELTEKVPELRNFILPGDNQANAYAHLCRTIIRRAERDVVALDNPDLPENILIYLNRLSDYFFALARYLSFSAGSEEIIWKA